MVLGEGRAGKDVERGLGVEKKSGGEVGGKERKKERKKERREFDKD